MSKTDKTSTILLIVAGIAAYFFSDFFRAFIAYSSNVGVGSLFEGINIFFYLLIFLMVVKRSIKPNNKSFYFILFVFFVVSILSFIYGRRVHTSLVTLYIFNMVIPLVLIGCKFKNIDIQKVLKIFLSFYNWWMVLLSTTYLMDYLFDIGIQNFLINNFFTPSISLGASETVATGYRMFSPWGPPLFNGYLFLSFLILNTTYVKYFDKSIMNRYVVSIVGLVGIILTGSKACLLIAIIFVLLVNLSMKNKVINFLLSILLIYVFFTSSFFKETIWMRFTSQYQMGNLTSGRNDIVAFVLNGIVERPGLIIGGGANYSRVVSNSLNYFVTNFEYPVIMLSYDYSVIGTFLFYILIYFIPMIKFIQKKNFHLCLGYSTLFIYLNTFNGIADVYYDLNMKLVFNLILFLLINKNVDVRKKSIYYHKISNQSYDSKG